MTGLFFLWLAIGEGSLFLGVLGFAVIEEAFRERRLRLEAEAFARALRRAEAGWAGTEAEPAAARLAPIVDIAA